ncbi:flagellar basal-body rod protein FlgG [Natranaerovirga hydrolytica]|uniref:Flagellar basal-body rod protein FlgG n=1 Tax=Natranaerovirga hydrolytica TaxID=680378 RepID=A0A4R1ML96_9FIRM|nr:flagellar hook-basal body protein [Natranaerovirga hydrolytica]TCK93367.1 flagellar basal-body rod protein FlgG [Natranaerovirga hydrolytica]
MVKGLYTATTGMMNQQKRMDTISNNLANVNTTGFKKDGVVVESFQDVLTYKLDNSPNPNSRIGAMTLGVQTGQVYTDYMQGSFTQTNNVFDVALQGEGVITIGIQNGEGDFQNAYTRDGAFVLSNSGELMTKEGNYVMGEDGTITLGTGEVTINENGQIYLNGDYVDTLQLVNFGELDLEKMGDNLYRVPEDAEELAFEGQVIQGFLEESNVNAIREMVDMISVMRTYESNQKVIQTQDETLGKVVNEVGRI